MKTRLRHGFLEASSFNVANPADIAGTYDIMFLFSSWDLRCLSVCKSRELKARRAILLLFERRDCLGLRDQHDEVLKDFCRTSSHECVAINVISTEVERTWDQVSTELRSAARTAGHPIRLFLDLSTCPRYYAAGILAACFKSGLASFVSVFYAEGHYPDEAEVTFTYGQWRTVAVPELDGRYDPRNRRFFLVSVGWEGWRTLRVVSRADPDRVSILFPKPGFEKKYVEEAMKVNADLINRYCIPNNHIVNARAGDAVAAWKALNDAHVEERGGENVSYLMTGTKPHAIALALRAIVLEEPTVLYVVPEEHSVLRTVPNGIYWQFDIRDVTVLPSSLEDQ